VTIVGPETLVPVGRNVSLKKRRECGNVRWKEIIPVLS
jgi:hypothetical protein